MLGIEVHFISKILLHSICACPRNILKIVTYVIEKMKHVFQFVLDTFLP